MSWMTAEKTVRRWAVFADCCYFKCETADTEEAVITDAELFFLNILIYNYRKSGISFLASFSTVHL